MRVLPVAASESDGVSPPVSRVWAVAELIGGGRRRSGLIALALLAAGAVLLPVVLAIAVAARDGSAGLAVLALAAGLIVDLLVLLLVFGVVSHRLTSQKLRALTRSVVAVRRRTTNLETSLGQQGETLERQSAELREGQTATSMGTRNAVYRIATDLGNRVQATQNLFALVPPRGPVPPLAGYVAAPDVLLLLVQKLLSLRPRLAIECGSGASTLFLALAVQQYHLDCRLVSLEHDLEYVEHTRALLADHGVSHLVDVRHAPLAPTPLTDHAGPWYAPAAYEDLHDIGLVFVDGPPGGVGPHARYPLVPLLAERLADSCAIVVDDMRRDDERQVAARWQTQLEDFRYTYLHTLRDAAIFERPAR